MKAWNIENAEKYQRDEFEKRLKIRINKSYDYASTEDILGNFKRVAAMCKLFNINVQEPFGYAQLMCLLKLDRINNLINNDKKPKNESVKDSFRDLKNYIDLSEEILIAEEKLEV